MDNFILCCVHLASYLIASIIFLSLYILWDFWANFILGWLIFFWFWFYCFWLSLPFFFFGGGSGGYIGLIEKHILFWMVCVYMVCKPKRKHCLFMNLVNQTISFFECWSCAMIVAEWWTERSPSLTSWDLKWSAGDRHWMSKLINKYIILSCLKEHNKLFFSS